MVDKTKPDEPMSFPVEVTVNGVKVTVTLMLKPDTAVTREQKPGAAEVGNLQRRLISARASAAKDRRR